jgi:CRP/FNR family cyclic AMP-dependent transcriptional regulator
MAKGKRQSEFSSQLKTVPIFSACTKKELESIAAIVKQVEFPAGKTICKEGDTGVGLHVVVEGETKVQIRGRTRRRLGPGAFFGEIALLDGGPRSATVIADTRVKTLAIPAWTFRSVIKSQPKLALKMLEETCRRLRTADSTLSS